MHHDKVGPCDDPDCVFAPIVASVAPTVPAAPKSCGVPDCPWREGHIHEGEGVYWPMAPAPKCSGIFGTDDKRGMGAHPGAHCPGCAEVAAWIMLKGLNLATEALGGEKARADHAAHLLRQVYYERDPLGHKVQDLLDRQNPPLSREVVEFLERHANRKEGP